MNRDNEGAAALVAHARSHSLADLLRRTAARYPEKLALVAGTRRVTLRRVQPDRRTVCALRCTQGAAQG